VVQPAQTRLGGETPRHWFSVNAQRALPPGKKASHCESLVQGMQLKKLTHPTPAEAPTTQKWHGPPNVADGHPALPLDAEAFNAS
jgi:hypothetical protein